MIAKSRGQAEATHYISVRGGVLAPGRYEWNAGMTVLDAIQLAGGFTASAVRVMRIIHINGATEVYRYRFGAEDIMNAPVLRAGDCISVPQRLFWLCYLGE